MRTAFLREFFSKISFLVRFATVAMVTGMLLAAGPAAANSKYAGFVMDARTGKVLYADKADARRYPASLTKMMTLYMLFEALDRGKIKKSSRIKISRHAASQPPSKLGLRPGQTISVETAIYALVTKSANDVAAAVGEFLGGSESRFAAIMTRKAHALGMRSTRFKNASGLPNSHQVTTARDMAKLGLALREHFPRHYRYFSTRSFKYGKRRYRNHNRLLGRIRGVDGIKTGYTRASGYNLVTSVTKGKRRIIAVVLGGRTGKSRNRHMTNLISRYLPKASTQGKKRQIVAAKSATNTARASAFASLPSARIPVPSTRPQTTSATHSTTRAAKPDEKQIDPITTASNVVRTRWIIQVASLPTMEQASLFLDKTSKRAGTHLASATPYAEKFVNSGTVYYRARYSGFSSQAAAVNTCKALKRKKIACFASSQ